MKTVIRKYSDKFNHDIEYLISFLRGRYAYYKPLSVVLGENMRKEYKGNTTINHIYINLAYIKNEKDLLETITHEFSHLKQFDRFELGYDDNGGLTWHGESIKDSLTAPWELDAIIDTINLEKELDMIAAIW
jgi:hypothetical protein